MSTNNILIDQFSSEVGEFFSVFQELKKTAYDLSQSAKVSYSDDIVGDEDTSLADFLASITGSTTSAGITNPLDLTTNPTVYNSESTHTEKAISFLEKKIKDRLDLYLDDKITLIDFLSNNEKDFDNVLAKNSLGVLNSYKHGLSIGLQLTATVGNKQLRFFIVEITENTFRLSLFPNGVPFTNFQEGIDYVLSIVNNQEITDKINGFKAWYAAKALQWQQLWDKYDPLKAVWPTDFFGLDITAIPVGNLIQMGNDYSPKTFSNREWIDVIKYFTLVVKKIIHHFELTEKNKTNKTQQEIDRLKLLVSLNKFLKAFITLLDIIASVEDIIKFIQDNKPNFEILSKLIGAWMNPAFLLEAGMLFIQMAQKQFDSLIEGIKTQLENYLLAIPIPLPVFLVDFLLKPGPLPSAGLGFIKDGLSQAQSAVQSTIDFLSPINDSIVNSMTERNLREKKAAGFGSQTNKVASSAKPAINI